MRVAEIVNSFKRDFPGKNIVCLPPENPGEIICEIEPAEEHPSRSATIAVIEESGPHFHRHSKEVYEVEEGRLSLFVDGEERVLDGGDFFSVLPGQAHWARGSPARVRVISTPGWTAEDHISIAA